MSLIEEITPTIRQRVIDLVRAAGIDTSDWANFKGKDPATNPNYCYEWAFVEAGKVVVLSLWLESMREEHGTIVYKMNLRDDAKGFALAGKSSIQSRRALRMDEVVQTAIEQSLPVRVIVCRGNRRKIGDAKSSQVKLRLLDSCPWSITSYDYDTGDCVLTRGAAAGHVVDQSSLHDPIGQARKRKASGTVYVRSLEVRRTVLHRSKGKCEWCSAPGFALPDGSIFVETHHVVPLSEGGADSVSNVVALCPNHHREAHYGQKREELRRLLQDRLNERTT